MLANIELEIAELYQKFSASEDIAYAVLEWLKSPDLSYSEQTCLFAFLYNGGYFRFLSEGLKDFIQDGKPVPWQVVTELCGHPDFSYQHEIGEAILFGAEAEGQKELAVQSRQLDLLDPRFAQQRRLLQHQQEAAFAEQQSQLMEKITFFRGQRLVEQEREAALLLYRINPNEPKIKQALADVEGRWARDLIERRPARKLDSFNQERLVLRYSQDDQKSTQQLSRTVQAAASENPELTYDLSILLYFIDLKQEALALLRTATRSPEVDWFKLELLLETRHFIETLDLVQQMEIEYCNDPDTLFATTYARARALKELGKTAVAVDLLKSIVNIKPNYRSAQSLLTEWREE